MKEKKYEGKTLAEVEVLAVSELGIAKEDMYFNEIVRMINIEYLNIN